jgi:hypothetical protein
MYFRIELSIDRMLWSIERPLLPGHDVCGMWLQRVMMMTMIQLQVWFASICSQVQPMHVAPGALITFTSGSGSQGVRSTFRFLRHLHGACPSGSLTTSLSTSLTASLTASLGKQFTAQGWCSAVRQLLL